MKLVLSIDLPAQPGRLLPADWAAAALAALRRTLSLDNLADSVYAGCEVSLTLTDNGRIRRLNREFRGLDRPTDVLSFPQYQPGERPLPKSSLGDIVISLPKMAEQARAFGHSQKREFVFLFVHGLLHLLGYDHEISPAEERRQFARQEEVLNFLGILR